jgi:hypothetical protein
MSFTVIVALLTSLISLPIELFLIFILEAYGSTWPGSRGYVDDLNDKKVETDRKEAKEMEEEKERKERGENEMKNDIENGAQILRDATFTTEFGLLIQMTGDKNIGTTTTPQTAYIDFASPTEEATILIDKVNKYLFSGELSEDGWLPWELHKATDYKTLMRTSKIDAIEIYLGIQADGNNVPLTLRQKLFFGTADAKLAYKLRKVRKGTEFIIEEVDAYTVAEVELKDMRLIRSFIFECLSPFKRFTLAMNISAYDLGSSKPYWIAYIVTWSFVTGKH